MDKSVQKLNDFISTPRISFCHYRALLLVLSLGLLSAVTSGSASAQNAGPTALDIPEVGLHITLPPGFVAQTRAGARGTRIYQVTLPAQPGFGLAISPVPSAPNTNAEQVLQQTAQQLSQGIQAQTGQAAQSQRTDVNLGGQAMYGILFKNIPDPKNGGTLSLAIYTALRDGHLINMTISIPQQNAQSFAPVQQMLNSFRFDSQGPDSAQAQGEPMGNAQAAGPQIEIPELALVASFGADWHSQAADQNQGQTGYRFINPASQAVVDLRFSPGVMDSSQTQALVKQLLQSEKKSYPKMGQAKLKNINVSGQKAWGYALNKVDNGRGNLVLLEKYLLSNGDYTLMLGLACPWKRQKAARKAFATWVKALQMQKLAPTPPPPPPPAEAALHATFNYTGPRSSLTRRWTFDGQGGVVERSSFLLMNRFSGAMAGGDSKPISGRYTVQGDAVTLMFDDGNYNCTVLARDQDSIYKLKCGDFWMDRM